MNSTMPYFREDTRLPASAVPIDSSSSEIVPDNRMQRLVERRDRLGREGRRSNFVDNPEFLIYHWSGVGEGFAPPTGEQAVAQRINVGDNNCRVFLGTPFPNAAEMPSRVDGLANDVLNWARDYAFFSGS